MRIDAFAPADLANFAANLVELLEGDELSAIDENVRAALLAALGAKPAMLMEKDLETERLKAMASSSVSSRNATFGEIVFVCRQTRDALRASRAPRSQWELCGFDYPSPTRSTYIAQIPSALAVEGFSNGVNRGKFQGNNRSGSVLYEIWRRDDKDAEWVLQFAQTPPTFTDEDVVPGQYYEYKVRAKAAKNISAFSNTALVYGSR